MTVDIGANDFILSLVFSPVGISTRLSSPSPESSSDGWFDRLNAAILGQTPSSGFSLGIIPNLLSKVDFRYLSLESRLQPSSTPAPDGTFSMVPGPLSWQISLIANWTTDAVVELTYDSSSTTFTGRLLFLHEASPTYAKRLYSYDPIFEIYSTDSRRIPESVSLWKLLKVGTKAPSQIPNCRMDLFFPLTRS
jgi:hypothetical protein